MKEEAQEKQGEGDEREGEDEKRVSVWDCGSPLYDSFELASLCHLLDRHLMILPFTRGSRRLTEPEESRNVVVMGSSWRLRGREKEKAKKWKVGLRAIRRYVSFWKRR